jgi:hypothetical protein
MKKLSLKGFDFKAFFVDHAEKIAFGLGVLITLLALAGTDWARYGKSPEEIISKLTKARTEVQSGTWPEGKRAEFALEDFMERANQVRGPLALSKFEFSTPLWHPMYRKQELRKEPELLAVLDLDAKYGSFTLGIMPQPAPGSQLLADGTVAADDGSSAAGIPGTTPATPPDFDNEFAVRRPGGTAGAGGVTGDPSTFAPDTTSAYNPYAVTSAMTGMNTYDGSSADGMMGYAGVTGMECRGERFIAVRGIWPVRQQLEKMQKALSLGSLDEARMYLKLTDFVLERQTAVAGSDPWSGPWDVVDMTRVEEILNETFDYDFDPIDPRVTDVVITMPLPARLVGYWGDYATHPKIKNFELTGAALEQEKKLQEKLLEEWERMRLQEQQSPNRPRRGFAKHSRNTRMMVETIYSSEETADMFNSSFADSMRTDTVLNTMRLTPQQLEARLKTPVDRLLLFRFFDFEVQPGHAYRYRVKLVIDNPNYGQQPEAVIHPDVAQGLDRETPWSKESNVCVVPESVNYFLREVPRDPVNEQKHPGKRPVATFSFFEWDSGVGTMIADSQVSVWTFGQFIGETKKALRLNVAKPSFKDEDVTFRSDDLFLDGEGDLKVAIEDHKDLKLPAKNKGRVGILASAVLVNKSGELVTIDPTRNVQRERQLATRLDQERAGFKHLENKEEQPAGALDGSSMPGMEGMMYDADGNLMMDPKAKKKKKTSRKPTMSMMGSGSSAGP